MARFRPYAKHDPEADAIYVVLAGAEVARSHTLDDLRVIDYSSDGLVAGVEFLGVGGGIDLTDIPFSDKVEKAIGELGLGIRIFA
jgi:uncharacterized protein YuzE